VPESILTILKFCLLALIYLFVYRVVRVVAGEMRGPVAVVPAARATAAASPAQVPRGHGPAHLRIVEPPERRGETFALRDELTVGRGGGCGIVLDDTFVSQVHARVFWRDGEAYVEDLGSRNGTLLNGHPVLSPELLRRGDKVQFGKTVTEAVR
jgi:pSer/pThr/pTyr-binding forkhead associated (FHA) protein